MLYIFKRLGLTFWHTFIWMIESLTIVPGLWKVFELKAPRVTFFGGAKLKLSGRYAQAAKELASLLIHDDVSIITGGGSGIMEAAEMGAKEAKEKHKRSMISSLGLSVSGLGEGHRSEVYDSFVCVKSFAMRKWLMINFSVAYVVFPGGVGTYDELAQVLTLMATGKLRKSPIILFGEEYWSNLEAWVNEGVERGFIDEHVKDFFVIVNNVQTAFNFICKSCTSHGFLV